MIPERTAQALAEMPNSAEPFSSVRCRRWMNQYEREIKDALEFRANYSQENTIFRNKKSIPPDGNVYVNGRKTGEWRDGKFTPELVEK